MTELVTNAVLHAGTDVRVALRRDEDTLRVEVADGSAAAPARRRYADDAQTGRGLLLLDALATSWGVDPLPAGEGKVVWFEVDASLLHK